MTKVGWYAIGKSTTLESNKSLVRLYHSGKREGNDSPVCDLCDVHHASGEQGRAWYVRFSAILTGKGIARQGAAWGCARFLGEGAGAPAAYGLAGGFPWC